MSFSEFRSICDPEDTTELFVSECVMSVVFPLASFSLRDLTDVKRLCISCTVDPVEQMNFYHNSVLHQGTKTQLLHENHRGNGETPTEGWTCSTDHHHHLPLPPSSLFQGCFMRPEISGEHLVEFTSMQRSKVKYYFNHPEFKKLSLARI